MGMVLGGWFRQRRSAWIRRHGRRRLDVGRPSIFGAWFHLAKCGRSCKDLNIAQESLNRRRGGPRHIKSDTKMKVSEVARFSMAPVPKGRKVSFKVKSQPQPQTEPESPTYSPIYSAESPTYSPHTPDSEPDNDENSDQLAWVISV